MKTASHQAGQTKCHGDERTEQQSEIGSRITAETFDVALDVANIRFDMLDACLELCNARFHLRECMTAITGCRAAAPSLVL